MRRVLGFLGLGALTAGLVVGAASTVVGQEGDTGYGGGDAEVLGEQIENIEPIVIVMEDGETHDETIEPESYLDLEAGGFKSLGSGSFDIASERQTLLFAAADEEGVMRGIVQLPADLPEGDHTLIAAGFDENNEPREVRMGITVSSDSGGLSGLAVTGIASIVVAMIAAGIITSRIAARRREEPADPDAELRL